MEASSTYPVDFDPDRYRDGAGTEFTPAAAALDGDWVCEHLSVPFDRYYLSLDVQREANQAARARVERELGIQIVPNKICDHGVILNASLFGGRPRYHANATPVLDPVVTGPADVRSLAERIDAVSDEGLMHEGYLHPEYWEAARKLAAEEGRRPTGPASGGIKGLATICGQLCGVTDFLMWLHTNPEEMAQLTALVGRTMMRYIRASRAFDAAQASSPTTRPAQEPDGLAFASDLTGLMGPENYREFCAPHERELYEAFAPTGVRYYHADSNMRNHVSVLASMGVTTVNIGPMVSVGDILSAAPGMRIDGQVPPTQVLWRGAPDLIVNAVRHDIAEMKEHDAPLEHLRVCTAGSINPGTPLENIRAMFWAAMTYGRYDGAAPEELAAIRIDFDRPAIVDQLS